MDDAEHPDAPKNSDDNSSSASRPSEVPDDHAKTDSAQKG